MQISSRVWYPNNNVPAGAHYAETEMSKLWLNWMNTQNFYIMNVLQLNHI